MGWQLLTFNPAQAIILPKKPAAQRVNFLEPSQVTAFFAAIQGHPREHLYRVATVMGLREGELLGLLKTDVHLEKRRLRVDHQITLVEGKLVRGTTKTEASKRWLVIPEMLVPDFERALQEQPGSELLFPSAAGTPISPRNLIRQFKKLLVKAGLPTTFRFHDLRHTAGTTALAHGMDVKTAQKMLGHAQATTTLNVYAHAVEELQDVAVKYSFKRHSGEAIVKWDSGASSLRVSYLSACNTSAPP
jgi:integrase